MQLSVEDRLQIHELYARYCYYADDGDPDRWAGLFTPDGWLSYGSGGSVPPFEHRGTADLTAYMRSVHEDFLGKRGVRHHMLNIVVEETETGARGSCYLLSLRVGDQQPPALLTAGRYADELVKTVGGWRYRSRTVTPDI